ncbi:hypothetical protein BH11PSE2_BH11PSE2_07180 [soil metagenome]
MYEGTRTFIDHAAAAFRARGASADIVELSDVEDPMLPIFAAAAGGPTDLVFSINIFGEVTDAAGRGMATIFEAPHVVWHVDYVLSQEARLINTPAATRLLLVDPTQVDAVQSIYGSARFPNVEFMPHAAVGEAAREDADPAAFEAARPIPILWSGSLQKSQGRPWSHALEATRRVFDDAYDLALSQDWMPPHVALDTVLRSRGVDLNDAGNQGARLSARWIDVEVRMTRRFEFIKAFAKSGLPVHICGHGWEKDLYRFKNVTLEGPVPMLTVAERMRQSRVVLNTNGNFGAGSHERPLSALLAGASPFSDRTAFYSDALGDGEGVTLFGWRDLAAGIESLAELAGDSELAWRRAQAGKARVVAGHTWASRVDPILSAAGVAV